MRGREDGSLYSKLGLTLGSAPGTRVPFGAVSVLERIPLSLFRVLVSFIETRLLDADDPETALICFEESAVPELVMEPRDLDELLGVELFLVGLLDLGIELPTLMLLVLFFVTGRETLVDFGLETLRLELGLLVVDLPEADEGFLSGTSFRLWASVGWMIKHEAQRRKMKTVVFLNMAGPPKNRRRHIRLRHINILALRSRKVHKD